MKVIMLVFLIILWLASCNVMCLDILTASSRNKQSRTDSRRTTPNCSKIETFNLTSVLEKGIGFQKEFCSKTCSMNWTRESDEDIKCGSTQPSCALCKCDKVCLHYGDCCDLKSRIETQPNITDSTESLTHNHFHCFQTDPDTAVYIIASCPRKVVTLVQELTDPSDGDYSQKNVKTDESILDNVDTDSECSSCLSTPESVHVITSHTSAVTYCNSHCLECNEGRPADQFDLKWPVEKSCAAVTYGLQNVMGFVTNSDLGIMSENETARIETQCNITYEIPQHVSVRECEKQGVRPVIKTCQTDLLACNVSSEMYTKMEQLCTDYYSPVYTKDEVYQNIFCYLCQGEVHVECEEKKQSDSLSEEEFTEVNLSLLTALSGQDDGAETDFGDEATNNHDFFTDQGNEHHDNTVNQQETLTCQDGYWADEGKGLCRQISCLPGRNISGLTPSEAYCRLQSDDDDDVGKYVYKLNLVWYVLVDDQFLKTQNSRRKNSTVRDKFRKNKEKEKHNIQALPDASGAETRDTPSTVKGNDDSTVYRSGQRRKEQFQEQKDRQHFHPLQPLTDGAANTAVNSSAPSVLTGISSGSLEAGTSWDASSSEDELIEILRHYTGFTLKTLGIRNYFFQVYHMKAYSENSPRGAQDFQAELPSHQGASLSAVLYIHSYSGENRQKFEDGLLLHFVGTRNFTVHNSVVTLDQALPSSDGVYVTEARRIYHSNLQDGECCLLLEPGKQHELKDDIFRLDHSGRVIPFNSVTSCPIITFSISEFNVSSNLQLDRNDLNIHLHRSQFVSENQTVYICVKTLNSLLFKSSHVVSLLRIIESILTLISLSLSMICLLIIFITYSLFPSLRTLPGKNNMVMVAWLFIAQLLVLLSAIPSKHSTACAALGVILHYSWLSTTAWTCVCSFHMFHVFVRRREAPSSSRSHTFYLTRYVLAANLFSSAVVCTVITSNLYLSGGHLSGYGGRVCYLNSVLLVGVAFVLPLAVILMVNGILFSLTIFSISRFDDVERLCGRERKNVHIYFRLSSLTGLCWLLALLAEIPGLQALRSFSVLVNGCQGVTLFLSYACNKRVVRMWSNLLKTKSNGLNSKSAEFSRQPTLSSSL